MREMNEHEWHRMVEDGTLKQKINDLIWCYGHPKMTLKQAEVIAVLFHDLLTKDIGIDLKSDKDVPLGKYLGHISSWEEKEIT